MFSSPLLEGLAWGSLVEGGRLPVILEAQLCDLRPRFLPKCQVGPGYRAVARLSRAAEIEVIEQAPLTCDVGGGMVLAFLPRAPS